MGEEHTSEKKEKKKQFRKKILDKRQSISKEEVVEKSKKIKEKFQEFSGYKEAKFIMAYLPFRNEVDTFPIITEAMEKSKEIAVPKTYPKTKEMIPALISDLEEDLVYGSYGILEPKDERLNPLEPERIDLVIVPGVAFDEKGYRLGYGGGYYDRFILSLKEDVIFVAVAFEEQVVDEVPVDSWDQQVHLIFTEKRTLDFREEKD